VSPSQTRRVSFDDEPLIVVDEDNNVLGYRAKADCHEGEGILHRAFSVFLFNEDGEVLLQQRSADKPLWPMFWSNSCCSHPRRGETEADAAVRRIAEELGVETALQYVYTFTYHAPFGDKGSEREVCAVFLGRVSGPITANETEIADWKWIPVADLTAALDDDADSYTPWLRMEWARLRAEFASTLARYTRG
jgi:isopentenyl-diphosphate Delta-isomerase